MTGDAYLPTASRAGQGRRRWPPDQDAADTMLATMKTNVEQHVDAVSAEWHGYRFNNQQPAQPSPWSRWQTSIHYTLTLSLPS